MHEHQERYSSLVLAKMRAENVLKDGVVFNNDYEGDPVSGAVKVPVRDDEVKVGDYDKSAGGELSESSTIYRPILINKEKYVNELLDGYDVAAVPDNLVADRLDSAGYSMATTMDNDGASSLISQGTRVNLSSISASTIYSEVVNIRKLMSKAKVPNDGKRYLLVTPDIYAEMLKSDQFVKASDLGAEMIQSGILGRMAGFNIIEWNDDTANLAMIAGHPKYATRVHGWKVPVAVNDLKDGKHIGASAVQGRAVYGHEVLRTSAIYVVYAAGSLTLTQGALASGKCKVTVIEAAAGSFVYRVNPAERAKLEEDFTAIATTNAFASNSTQIACEKGDVIEIIDLDSNKKCVKVGYITVA
ncbi:MAG: hypothetical protein ACI4XA_03410 [Oscillospiraceae bacterium]